MHEREMLIEAVRGVIARTTAASPPDEGLQELTFDGSLWAALADHGFTLVNTPEEAGGAGAELPDAAAVVRVAGELAVRAPLGEAMLVASWALAAAGIPIPAETPLTVAADGSALRLAQRSGEWWIEGRLTGVPWGATARCVAVADVEGTPHVVLLPLLTPAGARTNVAGEPRHVLDVASRLENDMVRPAPPGVDAEAIMRRGALARAIAMAGALGRCRDLTVTYVAQRSQFGRPIAKFQAVQQQVAELVAEVAAAEAAVDAAVAAEAAGPAPDAVAAAKIRAGGAADVATTLAHQLHGAIGITDEYELHHATRRLWAWRDEFGSATHWAERLGRAVAHRAASRTPTALAHVAPR